MTDAATDALMEKACSTPEGQLKASFVLSDLAKVASVYAEPATREQAEALLTSWGESADPLRKGMALAWLARARGALAAAGKGAAQVAEQAGHAKQAASQVYARAEGKAGNLGAAAGEKLARSKFNAKRMGAAREAGGVEAQGRMAQRLQPNTPAPAGGQRFQGGRFLNEGTPAPGGRMQVEAGPHQRLGAGKPFEPGFLDEGKPRNFGSEQAGRAGNSSGIANPADRTAAVHADALSAAFRSGAEHAANAHAGAAARHGRVAARHAFKAGMQLSAVAAGSAAAGLAARGAGQLSQKQHEERVNAAKAPRHRQAAAPRSVQPQPQQQTLGKGFGATVGAFARKTVDSAAAFIAHPDAHKIAGTFAAKKIGGAAVGLGATAALSRAAQGAGVKITPDAPAAPAPPTHVQRLKAMLTPKATPGTGA